MKILNTVKYYFPSLGGMESVVQNIIEGLISESNDFKFVVFSNSHFQSLKTTYEIKSQVTIIKEKTPFLFKSQPLNFWYPSLRKLLLESDIVYHHFPFPNLEFALLCNLNLLKKKKLIITWHANVENTRWRILRKIYFPIIRKLLSVAHTIVVTSPQLLEYSEILNDFKEKVVVIPLSHNINHLPKIVPKSFPDNHCFKLLFVGKLREYKGLSFLLDAIKDLNVELVIVGSGENKKKLLNQISLLGISHKVIMYENVSNFDLDKIYKTSDLFVLPSINEAEAFGIVQLEAMSYGLPVINTNLRSGVPFVSLDGITGLTVPPAKSIDLKNAILLIISNKSLYEGFSQNCLIRSEIFSKKNMIKEYLFLFSKLFHKKI